MPWPIALIDITRDTRVRLRLTRIDYDRYVKCLTRHTYICECKWQMGTFLPWQECPHLLPLD
jgi:hypothetical protein